MTIELDGASLQEGAMDGLTLLEVYVGSQKVWPTTDVVQITLGTGLEARDQLRAALADRGLDYTTVTEIPFEIELVGSGSARSMFNGCSALASAPAMDTGKVTTMGDMFNGCAALTTVPPMDTSSVMYMNGMFRNCSSLTHVPDMDTGQVTNMSRMFNVCSALASAPAMDTGKVTTMYYMFEDCSSLTYVPDMDTSSVTDMRYMFRYCSALTDGNVRLIGRHPQVNTAYMIAVSGLTREPFYDANGNPI